MNNAQTMVIYRTQKSDMLKQAQDLSAYQKQAYGHIDISQPMCENEKALKKQIADLHSEINQLVRKINQLKKAIL